MLINSQSEFKDSQVVSDEVHDLLTEAHMNPSQLDEMSKLLVHLKQFHVDLTLLLSSFHKKLSLLRDPNLFRDFNEDVFIDFILVT